MITFKAKTPDGEIIKSRYSTFTFPAGEAHIKFEDRREQEKIEIAILQFDYDFMHRDLFHLAMWSNIVFHTDPHTKRVAVIPYFPGARADRGYPFGADVYVDFIYSMMLDQVITYDPHSEVYVDLLGNDPALKVTPVYPHEVLVHPEVAVNMPNVYDGIIAPDKGAKGRAGKVAEAMGLPLYTALKERDFGTGKLSGFGMEQTLPYNGRYLIVDDICDGGGTFVGLANHLQETTENVRLDLYVSHGVFSGEALDKLGKTFGRVITTNSYSPWRPLVLGDPGHFDDQQPSPFRKLDIIRPLLERIAY